jgi:hypothetical protein
VLEGLDNLWSRKKQRNVGDTAHRTVPPAVQGTVEGFEDEENVVGLLTVVRRIPAVSYHVGIPRAVKGEWHPSQVSDERRPFSTLSEMLDELRTVAESTRPDHEVLVGERKDKMEDIGPVHGLPVFEGEVIVDEGESPCERVKEDVLEMEIPVDNLFLVEVAERP